MLLRFFKWQRSVGAPPCKKPVREEIAVQTVRDRYSTYPSHGLTIERLTSIFKEADQGIMARQVELFEEMEEKDLHLGALLQTRRLQVQALEYEIIPASASRQDKTIAEAAKEMLSYVENFEDAILDLLDAIGKGFSVCEIIWEVDTQVWVKELKWRHQKQFTFNSKDAILETPSLLTIEEPVYGAELIENKFVVHKCKSRSGLTPRAGLLRPCSYAYLFKNYDVKSWLMFNELFSVPMRMGKYKTQATKEEIETLKRAVMSISTDAACVISESTVIELLEVKQRGDTASFKDFIEFCDKAMSKAVLGHTGSVESTPGRLGNEQEAQNVRQDILEADARALMGTITTQILRPWTEFNYGVEAGVPKFKFNYESKEDLEKTAKVYSILVKDIGLEIGKDHIRERFGVPKPQEGEEALGGMQADNSVASVIAKSATTLSPSRHCEIASSLKKAPRNDTQRSCHQKECWRTAVSSEAILPSRHCEHSEAILMKQSLPIEDIQLKGSQQSIDGLTDRVMSNWHEMMSVLVEPLLEMTQKSSSYEELKGRLQVAFGGLDDAKLMEALAYAMFSAKAWGRISAN